LIDRHVAPSLILDKLENIFELEVDLIVEVAHPSITKKVNKTSNIPDVIHYHILNDTTNDINSMANFSWNTEHISSEARPVFFIFCLTQSKLVQANHFLKRSIRIVNLNSLGGPGNVRFTAKGKKN
jgi:hypothetical protein